MKLFKLIIIFILSFCCLGDVFAQIQMTGRITNPNGNPIMGVLLYVEEDDCDQCAVLSNTSGDYFFNLPAEYAGKNIVVSYFGYDKDTIVVKQGVLDVVLGDNSLNDLDNIAYVSTQKKLQTNWEVPISISVLDFNRIEKLNIYDPQELSLFAPGYHNQTQSGVYSVNVIRGVASDGSNSYSYFQPRISVFMDGVSVTHMGTASTDIFDMQRVEVVKGPQGTLFGKGAEFGAVSYWTNKPVDNFEANLQMNYGEYNQKIVKGMVNTPFGSRLANRFAFYYNDREGYNTNLADGGFLCGKGAVSVRDIIRFRPNDAVSVSLSVDYEHNNEPGVSYKGIRTGVPSNLEDVSPYTPAYFDADGLFVKRDMGGINYSVEHQINPHLNYSSTTALRAYKLGESFDVDGTYLPLVAAYEQQKGLQVSEEFKLNWDAGSKLSGFVGASYMYDYNRHTMSLNTNLQHAFPYLIRPTFESFLKNMPDELASGVNEALEQVMSGYYKMLPQYAKEMEPVVERLKEVSADKIRDRLTQEYRGMFDQNQWEVTPDVFGRTTSIVYNVMLEAINEVWASEPSASSFTQYIDPENLVAGLGLEKLFAHLQDYTNLHMPDSYSEDETDINVYHEADIFADASYKITSKLFFTLGIRGTVERQKTSYCSNSDEAPLVGAFIYQSTQGDTHWLHDTEISWVGRAVLNYMITKNNNIYLSASKGRRPGSIYYNFSIKEAVKLRPETSVNYEFGIKGTAFKNHINYSLAGYYYDWLNFQSTVSSEGINGIRKYRNNDNGKANAYGAEASLELYLSRGLSMFADYSYIDAKFTKWDSDGDIQDLYGHKFRMTPDHSADFGLNITVPIKGKYEAYFRPTYSWMSDMYFSTDNTSELSQPAYSVANFTLGFCFMFGKTTLDISLYGKNVFDTQYLLDAGNTGQIWGSPTFISAAPAMFGVGMKLGFK